jgi:prevent-host-death family protein
MRREGLVMERIPISKFKATCLALLDRVKRTGEPILITRRGEPIAQILPPPPQERPTSWLGRFRGSGRIVGDIVSPASKEEMRWPFKAGS